MTHSEIIDSSIALPEEGVPLYVFVPDAYLPEDSVLFAKPWKKRSPTVTLSFREQDAELAGELKGDNYKKLVISQLHTLMQRLDELGLELIADDDARLQEEVDFD